jgi:hypothetical protein
MFDYSRHISTLDKERREWRRSAKERKRKRGYDEKKVEAERNTCHSKE